MPRILTKTSVDETQATPVMLTGKKSAKESPSTRKRKASKIIETGRALRGLVIEVDGYVLNDDKGLCRSTLEREGTDTVALIQQIESVRAKLVEIMDDPAHFGIAVKRSSISQTPHKLMMDEVEEATSAEKTPRVSTRRSSGAPAQAVEASPRMSTRGSTGKAPTPAKPRVSAKGSQTEESSTDETPRKSTRKSSGEGRASMQGTPRVSARRSAANETSPAERTPRVSSRQGDDTERTLFVSQEERSETQARHSLGDAPNSFLARMKSRFSFGLI